MAPTDRCRNVTSDSHTLNKKGKQLILAERNWPVSFSQSLGRMLCTKHLAQQCCRNYCMFLKEAMLAARRLSAQRNRIRHAVSAGRSLAGVLNQRVANNF